MPLAAGGQGELVALEVGGIDHQGLVVDTRIVEAGATAADQPARLALGCGEARAAQQVGDVDARQKLGACDPSGREAGSRCVAGVP